MSTPGNPGDSPSVPPDPGTGAGPAPSNALAGSLDGAGGSLPDLHAEIERDAYAAADAIVDELWDRADYLGSLGLPTYREDERKITRDRLRNAVDEIIDDRVGRYVASFDDGHEREIEVLQAERDNAVQQYRHLVEVHNRARQYREAYVAASYKHCLDLAEMDQSVTIVERDMAREERDRAIAVAERLAARVAQLERNQR